jgi:hypothetical protein
VANVLEKAEEKGIGWETAERLNNGELAERLFPGNQMLSVYKIPDWQYIHREMAKSGVTLSLLWAEYCEQCQGSGEIPSTEGGRLMLTESTLTKLHEIHLGVMAQHFRQQLPCPALNEMIFEERFGLLT